MIFNFDLYYIWFYIFSIAFAIDDKNLCSHRCEFCCRDHMCRTKEICEGSLKPLLIVGSRN